MNTQERIQSLEGLVGRAGASSPELAQSSGSVLRAIAASSSRALLPEKRLSASARMSVASNAMSLVVQALDLGKVQPGVAHILARIAEEASALAPGLALEHEAGAHESCPKGWEGQQDGPFTKFSDDGVRLTLARRPHLPGGEWTLYYGALPSTFGATAAEAAERAEKFCSLLSSGRIRLPRMRPVRPPRLPA